MDREFLRKVSEEVRDWPLWKQRVLTQGDPAERLRRKVLRVPGVVDATVREDVDLNEVEILITGTVTEAMVWEAVSDNIALALGVKVRISSNNEVSP